MVQQTKLRSTGSYGSYPNVRAVSVVYSLGFSSLVLFASLCMFLINPAGLNAQTTGTILGRVADPSGAMIPNATVTAENTGTGLSRATHTTAEGTYILESLPTGSYRVTVTAAGFRPFSQTGITLEVAGNARVDVRLELGASSQSVSVAANALRVDTQSSMVGEVVDSDRVTFLPLNGRNILDLVSLMPGVAPPTFAASSTSSPSSVGQVAATAAFGRGGPTMNVSGARDTENNFMLDGTTMFGAMNNAGLNLPSPDAVQEFRVITDTFSAEYGRAAGGVVTAITKAGTNRFHGDLWDFLRNTDLDARNFFAASTPVLIQNQFGGAIGGPVVLPHYNGRNRSFFFFSYQGLRVRQQSVLSDYPATAAERAGNFSADGTIINPATGAPFTNGVIPPSSFDPLAVAELAFMPLPNQPNGEVIQLVNQPITSDQYVARFDHYFGSADTLSVRYYRNRDAIGGLGPGNASVLYGSEFALTQDAMISETHLFSPTLLNDFRISYTRVNSQEVTSPLNQTPRELGGLFNQDGSIPEIPIANISGRFLTATQLPLWEPETHRQVSEKLSWIHGRHSLKAGAWIMPFRDLIRQQYLTSGEFTFGGLFTGSPMADYFLGRPSALYQGSLINDDKLDSNYDFFVQDDYKVSSRLTLNYGLRYELSPPWIQRYNWQATIRPGELSTVYPSTAPSIVYPGDPGIPRGLVNTEEDDFLPRFGFAWDPVGAGRTVIRGGYGTFISNVPANISSLLNLMPPFNIALSTSSVPSFSNPYEGRVDPFPYTISSQIPPGIYPIQAYEMSPSFRNGKVQQFNLNLQHQFGSNWLVQAGYFGTLGRHLTELREQNSAVYGPGATASNVQSRRPYFPQYFGAISEIFSDINSEYSALEVIVQKRLSRGFTVQLAYTWSKSIDEFSNPNPGSGGPQNPDNYLEGERGLSDFDRGNNLVLNGIWAIPVFRHGWASYPLGGWQLTGIVSVHSGLPFNAVTGSDFALVGTGRSTGAERPNVIGVGPLNTGRPRGELVAEYFNTAAYTKNLPGQYGNDGRNNLIGPGSSDTDLGIYKIFKISERLGHIEFRAELYNTFNQVNFGNPNATEVSPAFGRLTSAAFGREAQFALKYIF